MQLTPETRPDVNVVIGYAGDEVRLRARTLRASALVTADRVLDWAVASVGDLTPESLAPLLALEPEVVLLATGARQEFPAPEVYAHVAGRGIGLEAMEVGAACRTYNVLVGEGRRVALAIVLGG